MLVMISIIFVVLISFVDIRNRRIPNTLNITFLLGGLLLNIYLHSFLNSFLGAVVGLSLLMIPYLLGGMGAGDVKAMAALGALIGHPAIFQTFLYTAMIGGAIALGHYVFKCDFAERARGGLSALGAFAGSRDVRCLSVNPSKGSQHKFPYAPAIALGYFAFLTLGNLI